MTLQIAIIGLNQVGASIGLALKEHKDLVKRVGHDREIAIARQAEKLDAVDSIAYNLPSAVRQADLVIITEPFDQLIETLGVVAPDLREGAVLMDTAAVKVGFSEQVVNTLGSGRHYVSLLPAVNPEYLAEPGSGPEHAHADYFQGAVIGISQPYGTHPEAIKLASDLVTLLGATPLYADATELDGLIASSRQLPQLLAAALINATTNQPGWREGRKIAGSVFTHGSSPILELDEVKKLGQAVMMNRENILRLMDMLQDELSALRESIETSDQAGLQTQLEGARDHRAEWIKERQAADWLTSGGTRAQNTSAKEMFGRLLGFGRKPGKSD